MASIFISYRREDAGGHAGRLCDRLNARLGADRVFMDVEDVRAGQDFVRAIDETVAACACVLAVIGPRWLEEMRRRRDGTDYVRREISSALRSGTTVIPVLVAGAKMPAGSDLPPDLAELSRRNAIELRDDRFDSDVARLLEEMGRSAPVGLPAAARPARSRAWLATAAAAVVAAALLWLLFFRPAPPEISGTWEAEMRNSRQQTYRIGLTLVRAGETLTGSVRYPTGEGAIQEGSISGDRLTFHTSHVPQFESEPAIIRFTGTIEDDGIALVLTEEFGAATGTARRIAP